MRVMRADKGTVIYHPELSNIGDCEIGKNCTIHSHVWIGDGVKIGNNVKIQAFAFIPSGVTIDDDVFIGPRVTFTNDPKFHIVPRGQFRPTGTLVSKGARIGAGAIILAGVGIGRECVIGMGSVVIRNVPDHATVVGNPARIIKFQNREIEIWETERPFTAYSDGLAVSP